MIKWLSSTVDNKRIQKLESEVADLRREQRVLRNQNEAMIECVETISKYEKQLIEAIETLAEELTSAVNETTGAPDDR
tara:strand:- start:123 stop:356 length:234 start_codon:yes stop_codon:yes gene_type:complete